MPRCDPRLPCSLSWIALRGSGSTRLFWIQAFGIFVVTLLAACDSGATRGKEPTGWPEVWPAPLHHRPEARWSVAPDPELEIGSERDGGPIFNRLGDVVTLEDGSILVVDRGDVRIHRFAPDGTHLTGLGRMGFGPGEFRTIGGVLPLDPGSFLVFDPGIPRFTAISLTGEVLDTRRIEVPPGLGGSLGATRLTQLPGSDVLLLVPQGVVIRARPAPETFLEEIPIFAYDRRGSLIGPFGPVWRMEMWGDRRGSGPIPFGRRSIAWTGQDGLYLGDTQSGLIEVWGGKGQLLRVVALQATPVSVTRGFQDAWIMDRIQGITDREARARYRSWLSQIPFPEHLPFFDEMAIARDGWIWIRQASVPGLAMHALWTVLSADGAPMAEIELPLQLQIQEIHADRIVGIWTDSLGVQTVRSYSLVRE